MERSAPSAIHLYRDLDESTYANPLTRDDELVEGVDYKMVYNATNDTIDLVPFSGVWPQGYDYTIVVDQTVRDRANNPLQPNRFVAPFVGLTVFRISLAGLDYGDAPDSYKTLESSFGPKHVVWKQFHLGRDVTTETEAHATATADGDAADDGVLVAGGTAMLAGEETVVTISATMQNTNLQDLYGDVAYVSAWFDFNRDGDFLDAGEHVTEDITAGHDALEVHDGVNTFNIQVPGLTSGVVRARFRFGSVESEVVNPTAGEASDGEIEDYEFNIVDFLKDFGDAPANYPVTIANNGAWHATNKNSDLYLGANSAPDNELDGKPMPMRRGMTSARSTTKTGWI